MTVFTSTSNEETLLKKLKAIKFSSQNPLQGLKRLTIVVGYNHYLHYAASIAESMQFTCLVGSYRIHKNNSTP